jgi:hypothetical protein
METNNFDTEIYKIYKYNKKASGTNLSLSKLKVYKNKLNEHVNNLTNMGVNINNLTTLQNGGEKNVTFAKMKETIAKMQESIDALQKQKKNYNDGKNVEYFTDEQVELNTMSDSLKALNDRLENLHLSDLVPRTSSSAPAPNKKIQGPSIPFQQNVNNAVDNLKQSTKAPGLAGQPMQQTAQGLSGQPMQQTENHQKAQGLAGLFPSTPIQPRVNASIGTPQKAPGLDGQFPSTPIQTNDNTNATA